MKIAFFHNLNFGGAKRAAYEQVKFLSQRGHTIDFYVINDEVDIFNIAAIADNTYRYTYTQTNKQLPFISRFIADAKVFFQLPQLHKRIAKDIDQKEYDIVVVHPDKLTQAPFLLTFLKTPTVYYCQEPLRITYEYSLRNKENIGIVKQIYEETTRTIRKKIDRKNTRAAVFPVASCLHVRERMIAVYDILPKVSYLGIDTSIFTPKKTKIRNEVFFVGAKDVPTDGYDLAIAALSYIPTKIRPSLRIVSYVKENNQRLSEKEIATQYSQSLATLCVSNLETFGLVPLESMACGAPVIATNVSGHREAILNNKTGFLVDFNPKEIAERIMELKKNTSLRNKISQNAIKHVRAQWNWKKRIIEFESLLQQCIREYNATFQKTTTNS